MAESKYSLYKSKQTVSNSFCVGLWFKTIDYVDGEILWLQNTLQGYF